jgi:hypothetical protein
METMPGRVQLRRTKGWRMPANTVKVDRTTKWGNPFVPGCEHPFVRGRAVKDRREAWELYRRYAERNEDLIAAARAALRGRNLACWCPLPASGAEDRCHAAVLLVIANS